LCEHTIALKKEIPEQASQWELLVHRKGIGCEAVSEGSGVMIRFSTYQSKPSSKTSCLWG